MTFSASSMVAKLFAFVVPKTITNTAQDIQIKELLLGVGAITEKIASKIFVYTYRDIFKIESSR